MKGSLTLRDKPFRFSGIEHNFDDDSEQWAKDIPYMRRCWSCGGMMKNIYSQSGQILKKSYPYVATFRIIKGKDKGKNHFKALCRACAYDYGVGVIEMDGETYQMPEDFNETKYKKKIKYKYKGW